MAEKTQTDTYPRSGEDSIIHDTPIPTPDISTENPEEIFVHLLETSKSNKNLQTLIQILKEELLRAIKDGKGALMQDILASPEVYENNPTMYQQIFDTLGAELDTTTLETIKNTLPKIYIQHKKWVGKTKEDIQNLTKKQTETKTTQADAIVKTSVDQADAIVKTSVDQAETKTTQAETKTTQAETKTETAGQAISDEQQVRELNLKKSKEPQKVFIEETAKARPINAKIKETLPGNTRQELNRFVEEYRNRPIEDFTGGRLALLTGEEQREILGANKENYITFLESYFLTQNAEKIEKDIIKNYTNNPQEGKKALQTFRSQIQELRTLDLPFPLETGKSIGNRISEYFPPTPATEAAIIQGEKYEKTHTVYRDGASLYFVNKENPKDIKQIEIFADRAVLTVSKNGLSLSKTLENPPREEVIKKREKRKLEGEVINIEKQIVGKNKDSKLLKGEDFPQNIDKKDYIDKRRMYEQSRIEMNQIMASQKETPDPQKKYITIKALLTSIKELRQYDQELKNELSTKKKTPQKKSNDAMEWERNMEEEIAELKDLDSFEGKLVTEVTELKDLEDLYEELLEKTNQLSDNKYKDIKVVDNSNWEEKSKNILQTLTGDRYGYGELGQGNFETLIEALRRMNPSGIWNKGEMDIEDDVTTQAQIKELQNISTMIHDTYSKTGEAKVAWQNIRKEIDIPGSETSQTWKNPTKLGEWIKKIKNPEAH